MKRRPVLVFRNRTPPAPPQPSAVGVLAGHSLIAKLERIYTIAPAKIPVLEGLVDAALERLEPRSWVVRDDRDAGPLAVVSMLRLRPATRGVVESVVSPHLTADDLKREYVASMGPDLGLRYDRLRNDFTWLYTKWKQFVLLFGTTPRRLEILNAGAPGFFWTIQEVMWDDLLMSLARFVDTRKGTLSLHRLPKLVDLAIRPRVAALVAECVTKTQFAKDIRNRRIAHRNEDIALGRHTAAPLHPSSRADIRAALEVMGVLLNTIEGHYRKTFVAFDIVTLSGDSEQLLYVLRDGLRARKERIARMQSGTATETDYNILPIDDPDDGGNLNG